MQRYRPLAVRQVALVPKDKHRQVSGHGQQPSTYVLQRLWLGDIIHEHDSVSATVDVHIIGNTGCNSMRPGSCSGTIARQARRHVVGHDGHWRILLILWESINDIPDVDVDDVC